MANAPKNKLIRLFMLRPYGHGHKKYENLNIDYLDYFLEDLAKMIIEQDKEKALNKWIEKVKDEN